MHATAVTLTGTSGDSTAFAFALACSVRWRVSRVPARSHSPFTLLRALRSGGDCRARQGVNAERGFDPLEPQLVLQ